MNRTIRQLTDSLTELLPEDQQYYKLSDLRSWGFPAFIVRRIRVELERNLAESMRLPQTDWANMQSETVQSIWKEFINAIRNEAWLPASYAATVIETAVGDVLEILVEPRKNIADVLYAADKELSLEEVEKRVDVLVVYPHFGSLLPRYMKKKGLESLSKERCAAIIKKADQKITERYTPLNWAQLLEPLFQLFNEQIDSNLLRLFFEDKKMPRIARKFDFMNEEVDRAKLIETLSSPESLNLEGYEDDQSDLFSEEEEEKHSEKGDELISREEPGNEPAAGANEEREAVGDENVEESAPREETVTDESDRETKGEGQESGEISSEAEHTLNTIFTGEDEAEAIEADDREKDFEVETDTSASLNEDFEDGQEDGEQAEAEILKQRSEDDSIDPNPEKPEVSEEDGVSPEKDSSTTEHQLGGEDEDEDNIEETDSEADYRSRDESATKETPMWQRFMSDEEMDLDLEMESEQEGYEEGDFGAEDESDEQLNSTFAIDEDEDSREEEEEQNLLDQPIIDLTDKQAPDEEELARLREALRPERDYFVEEIFGGSEQAYEEAVEDIAAKKNWRSASRYLEEEVFKRNMVDMYSEQAVDLTDRLHNYFLKKTES